MIITMITLLRIPRVQIQRESIFFRFSKWALRIPFDFFLSVNYLNCPIDPPPPPPSPTQTLIHANIIYHYLTHLMLSYLLTSQSCNLTLSHRCWIMYIDKNTHTHSHTPFRTHHYSRPHRTNAKTPQEPHTHTHTQADRWIGTYPKRIAMQQLQLCSS